MAVDLAEFVSFRIMPTRIHYPMAKLNGEEVVQMEYCAPLEASSWTIEGVYPGEQGVEHICECTEQGIAYALVSLLLKEAQYWEGERYLNRIGIGRKKP